MTKNKFLSLLKKASLQFALFTLLFSFASFAFCSISDTSYSSFSSFLMTQRSKNHLRFNYGEVKSDNLQDYTSFYWYADDVPGSNLRGGMHTFFKAVKNDLSPYTYSKDEIEIETSTLLYTTWDFKKFYFNFNIIHSDELGLDRGEIYITEYVANQLFPDKIDDYKGIINQSITCTDKELIVKGIIMEDSLNYFGETVGTSFVLGNFNFKPFATNKMIYEFIMFGSDINTFADVVCIERTIATLNAKGKVVESYYYDYDDGFVIGTSQSIKIALMNNHSRNPVTIVVSCILLIICSGIVVLYFVIPHKKISKVRDVIRKKTLNSVFNYFTSFSSFVFVLMLLKALGLLKIGQTVFNVFDFNVVTLVFLFWVFISISILVLNTYFIGKWKINANSDADCYFEMEI